MLNSQSFFSLKLRRIWVDFGTILARKGDRKGLIIAACFPTCSWEGPGDAPGTIFVPLGVSWESLVGLPGASWSYFGALGGLLGALKRHLQGVGRVSGVPWRFSALFSDPREYFIAVFVHNFLGQSLCGLCG